MAMFATQIYLWCVRLAHRALPRPSVATDRGQTTAEYALVLLGAAAVALLLLGWATQTGSVGRLLDFVMDQITGRAA